MAITRRKFFAGVTSGVAALAFIPEIISASVDASNENLSDKVALEKNDVILFQGDSITDAGREKSKQYSNYAPSLGHGYAFLTASSLLKKFPGKELVIYNRGISGNKVYQLAERWEQDCLKLKPRVLSILIGVNDYWHMRNGEYQGTIETYEKDYRLLLKRTKEELPEVRLVICEPFAVVNTSAVDQSWVKPFKAYQEVSHQMANEFNAAWVPFQKIFDEAVKHAPAKYWSEDGVHPSMAGAQLMADSWLMMV